MLQDFVYDEGKGGVVMIRVGTCAFQDHDSFYPRTIPQKEQLRYYAKYFSVVEIDSTFYGLLREGTWERWLGLVPSNFLFHVKAHGAMTLHVRGLDKGERREIANQFLDGLAPVMERGQLGCVLLQFPPWFHVSKVNVVTVERIVAMCQAHGVPTAVEFRERSWFASGERSELTLGWLKRIGAIHVICDEPDAGNVSVPFVPALTHPSFGMLRMHGRNREMWDRPGLKSSKERFDYRYSMEELAAILPAIEPVAKQVDEFHILMNNNSNNDAIWNGFDWLELLHMAKGPRPDLISSEQMRLL
ncbi:DUF72 domain-containing protein [Alicyclobacillus fastidiosus]|uniref:DUF72 domain-containing protein n=1 Tax=Alicyclobacillus fastidiosus TaxID=392011 RepID=A0ABY6ZMY7_9BACL|nr:DUF72 domain-containing protein [Alicyclobacillus fastidiosus]WAH44206.1 DUF72 domain-containing protein [Alicyclobacillus fastidiosus]